MHLPPNQLILTLLSSHIIFYYTYSKIYYIHTCSSRDEHLGCFQVLGCFSCFTLINTITTTSLHTYLYVHILHHSKGWPPRQRLVRGPCTFFINDIIETHTLSVQLSQFWQVYAPVEETPLLRHREHFVSPKTSPGPFLVKPVLPTMIHHWSDLACFLICKQSRKFNPFSVWPLLLSIRALPLFILVIWVYQDSHSFLIIWIFHNMLNTSSTRDHLHSFWYFKNYSKWCYSKCPSTHVFTFWYMFHDIMQLPIRTS